LIAVTGAAAVLQFDRMRAAGDLSRHTSEVLDQIDGILRDLVDAETGQRGYLLTGDRTYLGPYERGVKALPPDLDALRAMFEGTPEQRARLEELTPVIESKLTELESTIHLRALGDSEAVLQVLRTDFGRRAMEDIRARIDAMRQAEQSFLRESLGTRERRAERTSFLIVAGSALAAAIVLVATIALNSTARQRYQADRALRESNERLRVTLRSIGDAVIATDRHGDIVFSNPVAQALTGWPEQEARNRPLEEIFAIFSRHPKTLEQQCCKPAESVPVEGEVLKRWASHGRGRCNDLSGPNRVGVHIPHVALPP